MKTEQVFKYINEVRFKNLSNWSVGAILNDKVLYHDGFKIESIGNLILRNRQKEILEDHRAYKQVTIKLYSKGVLQRGSELIFGKDIGTKSQFRISEGQFIMSKIDARNGAFGIVPAELHGAITTQDFLSYNINTKKILPEFFNLITGTKRFAELCQRASSGTTGRQRVDEKAFLSFEIPVPSIPNQKLIADAYRKQIVEAKEYEEKANLLDQQKDRFLTNELGLIQVKSDKANKRFYTVSFGSLGRWDVWNSSLSFRTTKYKFQPFRSIVLGKPKYGANTKSVHEKSDVRYIRITDINEEGHLNEEFASAKDVEEQYILEDFDFLIARSGNTVGKTFLYRSEFGKALYAGYLVKYVLNQELVDPYYILYYTKSAPFKEWIASNQRISAQPNINGQEYLTAPFIIPPLENQRRVVSELDQIYQKSRELKNAAQKKKNEAQNQFESAIFNTVYLLEN